MNVSFKKPGGAESLAKPANATTVTANSDPAAPSAPTTTATELVPPAAAGTAVAAPAGVPAPAQPAFFNDDNLDASDLVLPRFNMVQKVGELGELYDGGTLVLDGQLVLASAYPEGKNKEPNKPACEPVNILIIGFNPVVFEEKVEGGARGETCRNEEEVVAKGGTTDYNEAKATKKPYYQRAATALVLIEQPTGPDGKPLDPSFFPLDYEGKNYALALYKMKGTAYTNGAKIIKSARKMNRDIRTVGYRGAWWSFRSQYKKFDGGNTAWAPLVKPGAPTTEAFRSFLLEFLGF